MIRKVISMTLMFCMFFCMTTVAWGAPSSDLLKDVTHLNHSTIKISGKKVVYFDPIQISGEPKDADIIFITHSHDDHFAPDEIKKLLKPNTTLVVPHDVVALAKKTGFKNIVKVYPNKEYTVQGIQFETVRSYNINKKFHSKDNNWVGYIATMNNIRYYIAGDTDLIPEMEKISADVAFLPIGGTYTMNANEAAKAASIIKPKVVVPIHFGSIVGKAEDARQFISELDQSIECKMLLDLLNGLEHLNHSTIKMTKGPIIYFDPIQINDESKDADLVFITHIHDDHFSLENIKKIAKDSTHFIAPSDIAKVLKDEGINNITEVLPNKRYTVEGINFTAVPAYNIGKEFHKKGQNWVGYIVDYHNISYYIAGDTDLIPEMKNFNVDIAFLPVGATYTMDASEAAQAANLIKPLVAVPIHYGSIVGTVEDSINFISNLDAAITGKSMLTNE